MAIDPASLFTIEGTVYGPGGIRRPGIRLVAVDLVDHHHSQPRVLVSATSDASARFSLQLSAEQALRLFRMGRDDEGGPVARPLASRTRHLAIVAYSNAAVVGRLDLPITLDGLAKGYDVALHTTQAGESTAMHRGQYQVGGVLRDRAGQPVAGLQIELLHRQLRSEAVVTSTQSGSDGSFRLSYAPDPLLGDDGRAFAIVVRALEKVGGVWQELVRSERICPAPRTLELVLTVPGDADTRTEIEKVAPLVLARIGGLQWSELTDDDAELIACETGLPLSRVVQYIRAERLAELSSLPVEAFYALGAAGMTMSVAAIGALPPAVLRQALDDAATRQVVPTWANVAATVGLVASTMGARAVVDDDQAPLGQLLTAAGLPAGLRESFAVGYVGRTGTAAEFWQGFAATHTAAEVAQVRFALYAGALANDHLPLVAALEQRRVAGQLVMSRDLAALGFEDWEEIVKGTGGRAGTGAPASYPGESQVERETLFATALARATEEAFPTAAIVQRVAKTGRWGLAASYVTANPSLDFRTTNARQYLASNPPAGMTTQEQDSLRQQLSEAQRLFMVAPRFDRDRVAGKLLAAGIHSAQQIAAMGPSAFIETHGATLGQDVAKVVFDNAHHVTSTLAVLALEHSPALNPFSLPAGGGGKAVGGDDAPPDLEGLLGPLDYCACAHCRSVLSPAAYLVDLLRFLEQRPALADEDAGGPGQVPFAVLVARRPDLLHTRLDCANTNTPLPTIDLVNEILEREVAGVTPAQWPQTARSAAELRAQPEHRLDAAYDVLRAAVYPWSLPFDLAQAEAEAFLGHLGVPRRELLEVCGAPSAVDAVVQARLGLTETAARIIAGQDVGQPLHALWGLTLEQWPAAITSDARAFLDQAQLDFEGFAALATTSYAGGGGQLQIDFATPCELEGATIVGFDPPVVSRPSRIHRFLRLQRVLGWTMAETDALIGALGSAGVDPLDATCLQSIARFLALQERLPALPRRELLAWFSDLSTTAPPSGGRSHYEEVFVEITAQGDPIPSPLALGQPLDSLSTVVPNLAAALSRTEDEVARILALDPMRTDTAVANLSWLYRWSSLARALGLRIDETIALVELSGIVPFAVLGAEAFDAVEELVRIHDEIAKAGVSVLELDGLLRHQGAEPAGISASAIAGLLVELVRGLQAVRSEGDLEGVVVRKLGEPFGLSTSSTHMLLLMLDVSGVPRLSLFAGLLDAIDFTTQARELADPSFPEWLENGGGGFESLAGQFAAIRWLAKSATLVRQLRLGDDDLRWLFDGHAATYGLLTPAALVTVPVGGTSGLLAPWLELQRWAAFGREHTAGLGALRALLDRVGMPSLREAIAEATGWEAPTLPELQSSIHTVATTRGIDLTAATITIDALWQLADAFVLTRRLGVTALRACSWAEGAPTTEIARDIQAAAKAQVPPERWPAVLEPLRDGLRKRQRDALVARVLAVDPNARTPEDLFGRLLIDPQVAPCAKTSRIKQALASVQTFVQRVQLHLEPGVNLSASASTEWQWLSRYRVWEANRKIFLWPENWLQPELRDDKTELFEAFENVLLERELTEGSAEAAVTEYVRELEEIAQLHVGGIYHERELGPQETVVVDRLHVFARTKAKPYRWFYRVRVDDSHWTPWEAVPLQIDAKAVIPAVFQRRLILFWPSFERRAPEPDVAPSPDVPLRKYHEIRMSWSAREDGRWGAINSSERTVSDANIHYPAPSTTGGVIFDHLRATSVGSFFFHTYSVDSGNAVVIAPSFLPSSYSYYGHTPRFIMRGNREDLGTFELPDVARYFDLPPPALKKLVIRGQELVPTGDSAFDLEVPVRSSQTGDFGSVTLFRAPFRFSIVASRQYPSFASQSPFVFQDRTRSFLVVPRPKATLGLTDDTTSDEAPSLEGLSTLSHGAVLPAMGGSSGSLLYAPTDTEWSELPTDLELQAPSAPTKSGLAPWEAPSFELSAFSHPFADRLLSLIRRHGIEGIYRPPEDREGEGMARQLIRRYWDDVYQPKAAISSGAIVDELEFGFAGAYSAYNWELFFHIPMFVALRFAEDKKFAQAQRWMHFVFDPTEGGNTPTPSRYWKVKPLFEAEASDVAEQLEALQYVGEDPVKSKQRTETLAEIAQWRKDPLRPHALARLRVSAYQRWVLMRYLDNVIEWGDHLLRQDTIESSNEALQLYVLAAQLLGPRPTVLPAGKAAAMTYADVQGSFDELSNFLAQAENAVPTAVLDTKNGAKSIKLAKTPLAQHPTRTALTLPTTDTVLPSTFTFAMAQMVGFAYVAPQEPEEPSPRLYFCVPHNETLVRYWDVVADRLFKLRHCLNIEGVERQLPLFEPPIDPGLLAQAASAGVDLSTALNDIGSPLPHYRFSTMLGLAKELAAEVRGFGSAVTEALRNTDAEELAELRASQESKLLVTLRHVRVKRIEEAEEAKRSIEKAIAIAEHRRDHYAGLKPRSRLESKQLDQLDDAIAYDIIAGAGDLLAATMALIPTFKVGINGVGPETTVQTGGMAIYHGIKGATAALQVASRVAQTSGSMSGIEASYERRMEDWALQVGQAEKEIERLGQDLEGAKLRIAIAKRELSDHDAQTANAQAVDEYLRERYTNAELYRWLGSELSRSYFQAYQLAFAIAKQAQACYRHELGLAGASFIELGYWDNRHKGLLAGDRLLHDLRRMETSYLANNRREYELVKRISVARIDPFALLQLQRTGECYVNVPEALYELDYPSHTMRRLRSVRLSVVGNTGPFDAVPVTLTLVGSRVRTSATSYGDPAQPVVETGVATQSIATSTGQSDAGLFEASLRDERYLPFEGKGAVSEWRITLPQVLRSFDYGAIADVVLELSYTAREGGAGFAEQVLGVGGAGLRGRLDAMGLGSDGFGDGRMWALSVRSRFKTAWAAFRQPATGQPPRATLALGSEHFPHPLSGSTLRVSEVYVVLAGGEVASTTSVSVTAPGDESHAGALLANPSIPGVLVAGPIAMSPAPVDAFGPWVVELAAGSVPEPATLGDLVLVVRYTEGG